MNLKFFLWLTDVFFYCKVINHQRWLLMDKDKVVLKLEKSRQPTV